MDRRSFLKIGAVSGVAAGIGPQGALAESGPVSAGVNRYVQLGQTGLEISDISFGSSRLRSGQENLVRHALAKGVNYFDTAESYTDGTSERVLGNALKGKRDAVVIASKMGAGAHTSREQMMEMLNQSLSRLQTDYIDVYLNHAVNNIERLQNSDWFEFTQRAKEQGKIRFTGISGHAGRLIECLDYALDENLVDVILAAYNFGQDPAFYDQFTRSFDLVAVQPDLPRVLNKAKQKNVGVIAMKVLRGAKLNDMRPFEGNGSTFAQAAFRWTLANENVDAAIISMTSIEKIDEYLAASGGQSVSQTDQRLLEQYARMTDLTYCRHACNDCSDVCPYGVPIADVLRTRMYAMDYGDVDFARREYKALQANAESCLTCDGSPCRNGCTYDIPIAKLCGPTHSILS